MSAFGEHRLGVELHTVQGQVAVLDRHDDAAVGVPGAINSSGRVGGSIVSEW